MIGVVQAFYRRVRLGDPAGRGRTQLSVASLMGFGIPFLFSPLWSRVYPVDYFATAALLQTLPGLFAGWSTLAMYNAIHTPRDDDRVRDLFVVGVIALLGWGLLLAVVCLCFSKALVSALGGDPQLTDWLWCAPILLVASGFSLLTDQILARRGEFGKIARVMGFQALLGPVVPAIGLAHPERTNFIVIGAVSSAVAGAIMRAIYARLTHEFAGFSWQGRRLVASLWAHRNFPRDVLPGSILTAISAQLPQLVVARFFGLETVGHFARAGTLLSLPSVVFANSFSTVFSQEAGAAYRERGDCRPEFRATLRKLLWVMLPCYGVLALLAPVLYPWFYGDSWAQAGLIAQPMALFYLITTVSAPLAGVLYFGRNTRWDLLWQTVRLPMVLVALVLGGLSGNLAVMLYSLVGTAFIVYGIYLAIAYRFAVDRTRAIL